MSNPVCTDLRLRAEVVNINGRNMVKTTHGPYLMGYDYNIDQARGRVERAGYVWADVEIKERSPKRH